MKTANCFKVTMYNRNNEFHISHLWVNRKAAESDWERLLEIWKDKPGNEYYFEEFYQGEHWRDNEFLGCTKQLIF